MNKIVARIHSDRTLRHAVMEATGLSPQALNEWKKLPKGVPAARVIAVAQATGLKPHTIRPDIFPRGT